MDTFCQWLQAHGWEVDQQPDVDIVATGPRGERIYGEAKGSSADIGTDCDILFGQLLRRMTVSRDAPTRFAAIVRDDPRSVAAVLRVPAPIRALLHIDAYAVGTDGTVRLLHG